MTFIKIINPATEKVVGKYKEFTKKQIDFSIQASHTAYLSWSKTKFSYRKKLILKLANLLIKKIETCSFLITSEMGKPISESIAEIEKCANLCKYYALNGHKFIKPESIKTEFYKSYRTYEPLGVILSIMPWNFPFWQVMRFAIPNISAGNGVVLKHSSQTVGCSIFMESLFIEAGFPKNLFKSLVIGPKLVSYVISHSLIKGVTLTGSAETGRRVASAAGAALKKVVMELGGSDPYLILDDANLDKAAEICVKSRLLNSGQVCIAAKRFIVVKSVQEKFEKLVLKHTKKYIIKNPTDPNCKIGPLISTKAHKNLHNQVQKVIKAGAKCILGGIIPKGQGSYYPPTILLNISENSPIFHEELFGPIICIISAHDEQHAIELANTGNYGLGAAVFTKDVKKGEKIANQKLEAGFCAVNDLVASDPRLPFGGVKNSGFGRELSKEGMREFVNIKTVTVSK